MSDYPAEYRYTEDHEWAKEEDGLIRVGVTAFAVEQLGDITLVDLPAVATEVQKGSQFGEIESVKAISELFSPVGGEIVAVNERLEDSPELVNDSPYNEGWLIVIKPSGNEFESLMEAAAYEDFASGE